MRLFRSFPPWLSVQRITRALGALLVWLCMITLMLGFAGPARTNMEGKAVLLNPTTPLGFPERAIGKLGPTATEKPTHEPPTATATPTAIEKPTNEPPTATGTPTAIEKPTYEPPTATATPTPIPPTVTPLPDPVFVGAGDIANCDPHGAALTANLLDTIDGTVFTVGDNAYNDGSTDQY